jgi:hypothetical protein
MSAHQSFGDGLRHAISQVIAKGRSVRFMVSPMYVPFTFTLLRSKNAGDY